MKAAPALLDRPPAGTPAETPAASRTFAPGTYKFTVKTAEQAVALIRERLGPEARVLSVRPVTARGFKRFYSTPSLEVVAQLDAPAAGVGAANTNGNAAENESESADDTEPGAAAGVADGPAAHVHPGEGAEHAGGRNRRVSSSATPAQTLLGLLRRSGLTEAALTRLQAGAQWPRLSVLPLHRALAETSRLLCAQAEERPTRAPLTRAAFLGTAGVGRTTALCKWLAAEVFRRARCGHVVAVEFDRPNPLGPLPVFAEALGVPLAHFPCETQPAVAGGFVYCDLPALSVQRPAANAALAAWLDRERIAERVLVLNAAYDRASLREAHAAGRDLGATHLVFTHLDEVPQWGKLWDYLFDEELEPLFIATGTSLTGDYAEDVAGAIARRTLPEVQEDAP